MSGFVRTYSPCSRVQSRSSYDESPSWVVTRTPSPSAPIEESWSWARALVGLM